MSEHWHYGIDGDPRPPVKREVLLDLVRKGTVNPHRDKVWTPGMDTWETPANVPELDWEMDLPTWRPMSYELWAGLQGAYLAFNVVFIMLAKRSAAVGSLPSHTANFFSTLSMAALIGATTMAGLAAYRNWELIQGRGARTTPMKAIGFLFIPIFNAVWIWIASPGLAEDYNRFTQTQTDDPPLHNPLWFKLLAAALGLKWVLLLVAALSMMPKLLSLSPDGSPPKLGSMSELDMLQMQLSTIHWNLAGTLVFSLLLYPVMFFVFRAVNHFSDENAT